MVGMGHFTSWLNLFGFHGVPFRISERCFPGHGKVAVGFAVPHSRRGSFLCPLVLGRGGEERVGRGTLSEEAANIGGLDRGFF